MQEKLINQIPSLYSEMKTAIYLLIIIMFSGCTGTNNEPNGNYLFQDNDDPEKQKFHKLSIGLDEYFNFDYNDGLYGKKKGYISGTWNKVDDSIYLNIIYPIDFKVKKSFVSYSSKLSPDSIYLVFYDLFPTIEGISYLYEFVPISLLETCITDTCLTTQVFGSSVLKKSFCRERNVFPKAEYGYLKIDTLDIFDPNDEWVDKFITIKPDSANYIEIYLARKPKYEFIDIPLKYKFKNNKLYFTDAEGKTMYFKKYEPNVFYSEKQ